jgi:hypothetical protein
MTRTAIAGHVTVDQLIDTKQVVALACAAHSLSPVHDQITLGEFTFEGSVLEEIQSKRLFGWRLKEDEDRLFGYKDPMMQVLSGELPSRMNGRWEMPWPRSATALTVKVGGIVRANDQMKRVELAIFIEGGGNGRRGHGRTYEASASYFTSFIKQRLPGPFDPLFLRAEGWGVITLSEYRTLGHGDLRTVRDLFAEFAKDRPVVSALSGEEKISPFRPERAWGYFVPEPLQPALLEGWRTQLADFKMCL